MDAFGGSSYQNSAAAGGMTDSERQRLAQAVGTNIQKILQNVSSMQQMIAQIGTPQDNQQLQQQLHQITHYTGQLAKDTSAHLQELSGSGADRGGGGDQRQWRLQKERLHNDFAKALNSFQAAQRIASAKEKDVIKRAKAAAAANVSVGKPSLMDLEEGMASTSSSLAPGQSKTQMLLQEEYDLDQLRERERAVRQLESDIVDVNTIFKDLATMVHEQGELVDSIEANVESSQVRVQEGNKQLREAEIYKNKARKKKVILAIIGLIVLAIIIAIVASQVS